MAIIFREKEKRQRYLILVLIILALLILALIWYELIKKKPIEKAVEVDRFPKIEINWKLLEDPRLEKLQPFEGIKPFEEVIAGEKIIEKIGRENPFSPY